MAAYRRSPLILLTLIWPLLISGILALLFDRRERGGARRRYHDYQAGPPEVRLAPWGLLAGGRYEPLITHGRYLISAGVIGRQPYLLFTLQAGRRSEKLRVPIPAGHEPEARALA